MPALTWKQRPMTMNILRRERARHIVMHSASLGVFSLHVLDTASESAAWEATVCGELSAATGKAEHVDAAKMAAEAWLRAHLNDLLRQLRDPDIS